MTTSDEALNYYRTQATYEECQALNHTLKNVVYGWERINVPLCKDGQDPATVKVTAVALRRTGLLHIIAEVYHHEKEVDSPEHYAWYVDISLQESSGIMPTPQEAMNAADKRLSQLHCNFRDALPIVPINRTQLLMGKQE